MPKKRYRPEEIISKLREADVLISQGKKVVEVIKALGVTDVPNYPWRQEHRGMSVPQAKPLPPHTQSFMRGNHNGIFPDSENYLIYGQEQGINRKR